MTDLRAVAIAIVLALAVGAGSGWYFEGLRWDADVAQIRKDAATAQANAVDKVNADLIKARAQTETIRQTFIDYKAGSANEIATLHRGVDSGSVRLRVRASCPAPSSVPGTGANASGTASGTAELDPAARSDYYALRAGLQQQYGLLQFCRAELKKRSAP